jgi:glycosyltransferase involved in cell wall biosynthesis
MHGTTLMKKRSYPENLNWINKMNDLQKIKRLKLAIIFNFSPTWMGGVIYILNIIKILDFLDDKDKPQIFLFYKPDLSKFLVDLQYPYMNLIKWDFPSITQGYLKSWLLMKNIFIEEMINNYSVDTIYPFYDFPVRTVTKVKLVSWCTDIQYKYYPEFFSRMQIIGRNTRLKRLLHYNNDLVLSSNAVYDDLCRFFKLRRELNIHIFHFVSVIDNIGAIQIGALRTKYNLPDKYFIVSNQFHKHKNHKVILQALVKLKEMGVKKYLAITGKFPSATESPYLSELHRIIDEHDLHDQICMLGVIQRCDQLVIMRHSQAVIQPSLFEGWSTVIEDAKSLQVPVIASNLSVNIEQLGNEGRYFEPHNQNELAIILLNYPERNLNDIFYEEYSKRVKTAANTLIKIFR